MKHPLFRLFALATFFLNLNSPIISAQHVLFGERSNESNQRGIYIDAGGTIYPDYLISDSEMEENGGLLNNWYRAHPKEFLEIADRYDDMN